MKYEKFIKNGFIDFGEIIDKKKCKELYNILESSRDWGKNLFREEKEVNIKLLPDKSLENPTGGTNPGKGKCNFSEKIDLSFIEKNVLFKKIIEDICGPNYEILLKKFVVAVPSDWVPEWLIKRMKKNYFDNLNPYIKEKYRDVTYFRGIDYHMDIMDKVNSKPDIITVYVYINDVQENMSPLHVINKSHRFCNTIFPHSYQNDDNKNKTITLCDGNIKEKMSKEILIGNAGNVYLWSCLTFHRTIPFKSSDKPRISLRFTIKKNKKLKKNFIVDEFLAKNNLTNYRNVKNKTAIIRKDKKSKFSHNTNNNKFY